MLVVFRGGPWAGRIREYAVTPKAVACKTDAEAQGMKGIYVPVKGTKDKLEWKAL